MLNKKKKLSVIINTHKSYINLLDRCIESTKNFKIGYKLIIIIDNCERKYFIQAKKILAKNNISDYKIYQFDKKGISYARNYGIRKSKTDWITFLDGDDYFLKKKIDYKLQDQDADLIIFNHKTSNNSDAEFFNSIKKVDTKSKKQKLIKQYLSYPRSNSFLNHCWSKIYKTKFLIKNKIEFKRNLNVNEDFLFNSNVIIKSNKIIIEKNKFLVFHNVAQEGKTINRHLFQKNSNFVKPIEILSNYLQNNIREKYYFNAVNYWIEKLIYYRKNFYINNYKPIITLIVNTHKGYFGYLEKALKSIKISKNLFKLIIINDDKDFNTKLYIFNLLKKYNFKNFEIFEYSKKGISFCRNQGIKNSDTKWITFIDGDDELKLVNFNFQKILKNKFDLVIFNHVVKSKNEINKSYDYKFNGDFNKKNKINLIKSYLEKPKGNSIITQCWSKIYKVKFLKDNKIKFNIKWKIYEDIFFVSEVLLKCKNLFIDRRILYQHIFRTKKNFYLSHINSDNYIYALKNFSKILPNKIRNKYFILSKDYWIKKIAFINSQYSKKFKI